MTLVGELELGDDDEEEEYEFDLDEMEDEEEEVEILLSFLIMMERSLIWSGFWIQFCS